MSDCRKILDNTPFNEDEKSLIETLTREGKNPEQITEAIKKGTKDGTLTRGSNEISKNKTNEYLEQLKNIVLKSKDPYKTLMDLFVGDEAGITSRTLTRVQSRAAHVASLLEENNSAITDLLNNEKFIQHFIDELDTIAKSSKTNNKKAYMLAKAVNDMQKLQVHELNRFGAGVNIRDDYVTKQWHDVYRMLNVTPEKWVNDIMARLDYEKTKIQVLSSLDQRGIKLKEEFNLKKYLTNAYHEMTKEGSGEGMVVTYLRTRRVFAFKSGQDLIEYNKLYGHSNLAHAVMENMDLIDNNISLGETMGFGYVKDIIPDKVTLTKLKSDIDIAKANKDQNALREAKKAFDKAHKQEVNPVIETKKALEFLNDSGKISHFQYIRLRGALGQVSGDAYMVKHPNISKFVAGFQMTEYLTKLGKATLSSVGFDPWASALNLNYQGMKPGKAYLGVINHMMRKIFRKIPTAERDFLHRNTITGIDGIIGAYGRNMIENPTLGKLNDMTNKMFSWNLLNWWTNASREGMGKMMSHNFAHMMQHSWDDLGKISKDTLRFKDLIKKYGINKKDWNLLKKVGSFDETLFNTKGNKKTKFITADWILEQEKKRKYKNGKKVFKRNETKKLRETLNRFFVMESRLGVPEITAADRAWMFGDSKRGSLPDVSARLFFQFRSHQVKFIRKLIPRMYDMGIPSLMHVLPALTLGYASLSLKRMVAGKLPPDPTDKDTMVEAVVQSGVAGFLGDFVAGQYGRYQHELDDFIFGSAYKTIKDWGDLAIGLASGDKNSSDLWNNLRYNVPFANLFWIEALVNYGLHYGIQETLRPGYLLRLEAREDSNTGFMVNPSSIWSYGGFGS